MDATVVSEQLIKFGALLISNANNKKDSPTMPSMVTKLAVLAKRDWCYPRVGPKV